MRISKVSRHVHSSKDSEEVGEEDTEDCEEGLGWLDGIHTDLEKRRSLMVTVSTVYLRAVECLIVRVRVLAEAEVGEVADTVFCEETDSFLVGLGIRYTSIDRPETSYEEVCSCEGHAREEN